MKMGGPRNCGSVLKTTSGTVVLNISGAYDKLCFLNCKRSLYFMVKRMPTKWAPQPHQTCIKTCVLFPVLPRRASPDPNHKSYKFGGERAEGRVQRSCTSQRWRLQITNSIDIPRFCSKEPHSHLTLPVDLPIPSCVNQIFGTLLNLFVR